jgi:hypothetical protein
MEPFVFEVVCVMVFASFSAGVGALVSLFFKSSKLYSPPFFIFRGRNIDLLNLGAWVALIGCLAEAFHRRAVIAAIWALVPFAFYCARKVSGQSGKSP